MDDQRTGLDWSSWRRTLKAALLGGVIAVVAPLAVGWVFTLFAGEGDKEGIGIMMFAGLLAAPVLFALGSVGGVLALAARGRPANAQVGSTRKPLTRWGWLLSGALAGYVAAGLTAFYWPFTGGLVIGLGLMPIWIGIGAALGRRVAVSRTASRPIFGSVIVALVTLTVTTRFFYAIHFDQRRSLLVPAVALAAGALTYWRLQGERSHDEELDAAG